MSDEPTRRRRFGGWRAGAVAVAAVLAVAAAAAAAVGTAGEPPRADPPGSRPAATTQITRRTLVQYATAEAEVSYGDTTPLLSAAPGTVTWLSPVGATVTRGGTVARANDQPLVLLYGPLPLYRALADGAEGRDVRQFEENLRALGYDGFTVDTTYSSGTAQAVKRWQKQLGMTPTGTVELGHVVYAAGAVRVAEHKVRVGASAAAELLTYTGTAKAVVARVPATNSGWAKAGAGVSVVLDGGRTVAGTVAAVGAVSRPPAGETGRSGTPAEPTVPVTITVEDQQSLGDVDHAPVVVRHAVQERKDVLAVPVAALLALAEGGYGLEVVEDARTRIVAVELGMFADGQVEVRGGGIEAGMTVGMPR